MRIWLSYVYRFLLHLYLCVKSLYPSVKGHLLTRASLGTASSRLVGDQPQTGKPEQRLKQHRLSGCILSMCSDFKENISAVPVFQIKKLS